MIGEIIGAFVFIGLLNFTIFFLLERKENPITSCVFTFMLTGFIVFLIAWHFIRTTNPAFIYLPILIFYLILNLLIFNRRMR